MTADWLTQDVPMLLSVAWCDARNPSSLSYDHTVRMRSAVASALALVSTLTRNVSPLLAGKRCRLTRADEVADKRTSAGAVAWVVVWLHSGIVPE